MVTDGRGRRVAGAKVAAGIPGSTGAEGGAAGKSGIGPDGCGARPDCLRGGAGTRSGNRVGAAADVVGAGVGGAGGAGASGAGGAVAASIVAMGGGTLAGSTGFLGADAAAGAAVSGSRATSRRTPSRSATSCAVNATRCAAGVGVGRAGTDAKLGYGSLAPGGSGRRSLMAPPSKLCHQATGSASSIRAWPRSAIVPQPPRRHSSAACFTHSTRLPIVNNSCPCPLFDFSVARRGRLREGHAHGRRPQTRHPCGPSR